DTKGRQRCLPRSFGRGLSRRRMFDDILMTPCPREASGNMANLPSSVTSAPSVRPGGAPASRRSPKTPSISDRRIVVGTRASALALWQTEWVLEQLRARWPRLECAIEEITTRGDRTQALQVPLTQLGDKSMFVAELERALLAGTLDVAVQPMNDRA